jgi:beta-lactamase regulating signal transducer with metallopeptidase domain
MKGLPELSDGFFGWLWGASWQAAILILLVLLAQGLLATRLTPRWRHALWLLVLVRLALPGSVESRLSLFNFFHLPALAPLAGPSETVVASATADDDPGAPSGAATGSSSPFGSWTGLRWVWLTGAVVVSGYFLASAWQLGRRIRRERPVTNGAVLSLLEDCKREMGVFTPLTLLETATIRSPALLGFIRPRLLLPAGLIQSFSLPELRYVFLHELGHLKRGDILLNWLMALPLALHWFNPLVWYALNRMRIDGESACDATALSRAGEGENQPYGQTIIKLLERFSCPARAPGLAGLLETQNQMKRRIGMIAAFKKTRQWPILAASLFALLALLTLTDARSQQSLGAAPGQSSASEPGARWRPWVIACSPRVGETEVDPALTEVSVTFDRDMSEEISWTRRDNGPHFPPLPDGQRAKWRDRRTCVLPVKLEAGQFYRVEINRTDQQDFRGQDGRAAAQSVLYFTTQGAGEAVKAKLTKPRVVCLAPTNGATQVDPSLSELRVTFDVPMWKGYSWTGGGGQYPYGGKVHWLDDYTCVLPVALKPDHQYSLGINSVAAMNFQSAQGRVPADPVEYRFRTRP